MSNENTAKETTQKLINVDFKHRLSVFGDDATALNLTDAVGTLTRQSDSVLNMIANHFVGDDERSCQIPDEAMFWAIESVRMMMLDINAIVTAYAAVEHAKNKNDTQ